MPREAWWIYLTVGGVFVLFGLGLMLWARREEERYYNAMAHRPDVREYLERWPPRIEPGALRIGGWVSLAVGVVLLGIGGSLKWWQ